MFRHPTHDCLLANVDGIIVGQRKGLEIKTANARMAEEWGEPGTDLIPTQYVVQVCHYMLVTGYREWDVAALIGGSDFRVYHLRADPEFEAFMLETLPRWWADYVLTGCEPPIDASEASKRYLHRKYPREAGVELAMASAEANRWATVLRAAKAVAKGAGEEILGAENQLKALIGERVGIVGTDYKVTWKKDRDRAVVNWQMVASGLAARLVASYSEARAFIDGVEANATEERPGSRRFIFKGTEEK
jgi:predicted phage-related endonuclease